MKEIYEHHICKCERIPGKVFYLANCDAWGMIHKECGGIMRKPAEKEKKPSQIIHERVNGIIGPTQAIFFPSRFEKEILNFLDEQFSKDHHE